MARLDRANEWVAARLGYTPLDPELFTAALTHRSATGDNNERLEFLGDAVLNLIVSERLYRAFPDADEGDLSRLRARVVSRDPLAAIAQELGLGDALNLGSGELKTGGFRRESILADALEAVCGAVFIDSGIEAVRRVFVPLFDPLIAALPRAEELKDPKTRLQEYLQARGLPRPTYVVDAIAGDPHEQLFTVSWILEGLRVHTRGQGSNRRRAEQEAADGAPRDARSTSAAGAPTCGSEPEPPTATPAAFGAATPAGAAAADPAFRAGIAAIVGRPNVGKSTLLNALVGEKLSIVTPRPQTTRHRVLGIVNLPQAQIAFVDTPGLHRGARRALNRAMNRAAASALADADVLLFVVEAGTWTGEDELVLERVRASGLPTLAIVNKVDLVRPRARLLPYLQELGARHEFRELVPVSALKAHNLERTRDLIAAALPLSPPLFPPEMRTDRDLGFRIAEMVREKLTLELQEEVPYGIAVEIERLAEEDGQLTAHAVIWVDRPGQKPIVIGPRGERLKRIGRSARLELNALFGRRLHIELWVKVREDWADNAKLLHTLGLE